MPLRYGLILLIAVGGCASPYELHCDDLLPPEEATYQHVQALVVASRAQACSRCHNTRTPVRDLNFEGPGVAYNSLTGRMPTVYEQVASGAMPRGGPRWSDAEL